MLPRSFPLSLMVVFGETVPICRGHHGAGTMPARSARGLRGRKVGLSPLPLAQSASRMPLPSRAVVSSPQVLAAKQLPRFAILENSLSAHNSDTLVACKLQADSCIMRMRRPLPKLTKCSRRGPNHIATLVRRLPVPPITLALSLGSFAE